MFTDMIKGANFKIAIFLFILGIIIFSDTFVENILNPVRGATYED